MLSWISCSGKWICEHMDQIHEINIFSLRVNDFSSHLISVRSIGEFWINSHSFNVVQLTVPNLLAGWPKNEHEHIGSRQAELMLCARASPLSKRLSQSVSYDGLFGRTVLLVRSLTRHIHNKFTGEKNAIL